MPEPEQDLRESVDAVLEPVWHRERRRVMRRALAGSAGRWAGGMLAISVLSLLLRLMFGMALPWFFLVGVGLLAGIAALPDPGNQTHLHR